MLRFPVSISVHLQTVFIFKSLLMVVFIRLLKDDFSLGGLLINSVDDAEAITDDGYPEAINEITSISYEKQNSIQASQRQKCKCAFSGCFFFVVGYKSHLLEVRPKHLMRYAKRCHQLSR